MAIFCRAQLPLRTQKAHWQSCWERIRRRLVRRAARTLGLLVWTTMPSWTVLLQAVTRRSMPSTSTTQTRQAPISLRPFQ